MARYDAYLKKVDLWNSMTGDRVVHVGSEGQFKFHFDNGEVLDFDNGEIYHVLKEGKKIVDAQRENGKL